MQLDQLLYFIDLCESGSLTDSAKRFFISPQGFRKSIASLENELGIRLVQVANHRLMITDAGREYYNRIKMPVGELLTVHQDFSVHYHHTISVGVSTGVLSLVAPLLTAFEQETACRIHISEHPDKIIEKKAAGGEVQLAFITGPIKTPGLAYTTIKREKTCFCVPKGHPLCALPSMDFSNIIGEDYITMNEEHKIYDCYEKNMARLEAPLQIVFKADSVQSLNQMADAGKGIAVSNLQYPIVSENVCFVPARGRDWQLNAAIPEACRDQLTLRFYHWIVQQAEAGAFSACP